jgi:hypothetical protein
MNTEKPLPYASVRDAAPHEQPQGVSVRFLGYANHATWEEHMEWATRGLPEAEREEMYAKYGAIRAEAEARDVTPLRR